MEDERRDWQAASSTSAAELSRLRSLCTSLQDDCSGLQREVASLRSAASAHDAVVTECNAELSRVRERVSHLLSDVTSRDGEIVQEKRRTAAAERRCEELTTELHSAAATVVTLQTSQQQLEASVRCRSACCRSCFLCCWHCRRRRCCLSLVSLPQSCIYVHPLMCVCDCACLGERRCSS
jgi:chromosome segregation ATPase